MRDRPSLIRVLGRSMEPALGHGSFVITLPSAFRPRRSDVVVLVRLNGARYVKRVAGVGGDQIELESGRLRVNGRSLDGRPPLKGAVVARWTVPADHLFVVGDNGLGSDDSRSWDQPFVPVAAARRALRLPSRRPRLAGWQFSRYA